MNTRVMMMMRSIFNTILFDPFAVFRPCMMHPRKIARQGQEIALPGLLDSERNEADKHPSFFLEDGDVAYFQYDSSTPLRFSAPA
jgi:hypothetical protein